MMNRCNKIVIAISILFFLTQCISPLVGYAAISNLPPLVKTNIPPNIFYTLDDSGSMQFEVLPENIGPVGNATDGTRVDIFKYCGNSDQCWVTNTFPKPSNLYNINGNGDYASQLQSTVGFGDNITVARLRSSAVNKLYYDPSIKYLPWTSPNGGLMAAANTSAALYNPVAPSGGSNVNTINFTQSIALTARWLNADATSSSNGTQTVFPALYYIYNGGVGCDTSTYSCFTKIEIKTGTVLPVRATARSDCVDGAGQASIRCSIEQELQNFANWFQYHRSRILTARGGTGQAFSKQNSTIRVGFGTINTLGTVINHVSDDFGITSKANFLNTLYAQRMPALGTPLRKAVDEVGQYFKDSSKTGPWQTLYNVTGSQITCRQNYNILMTDGYWNGTGAGSGRTGDYDGVNGPVLLGPGTLSYQYTAAHPYSDSESGTLADIGFYYWVNDLRSDWDRSKKNVPVSAADPAFWQHLVQFTVGLGVSGSLDPASALPGLAAGTTNWPIASNHQVDDLWHTAVNTRGKFFSAADPTEFADALEASLSTIASRIGDAAAVGTSSNTVRSGSSLFTSTYSTADWSGQLQQKVLDSITGQVATDQSSSWSASLPSSGRKVITWANAQQKDFSYDNLEPADQAVFTSAATTYSNVVATDIVNYILGGPSLNKFRPRTSDHVFGDFVNSAPQYLKEGENEGYSFLPVGVDGKTSYASYLASKKARAPMVYIGANDGMLHAFNGTSGVEVFAYIPKAVVSKLPALADPNYTHKFYVDGTPSIGDAYVNSSWKTILLGTTGAGGRSVFALDVSDPASTSSKVLWEINSDFESELGYTIGSAQIGRAPDGTWVAVLGNGYQSASNKAMLFIINLSTGAVSKIDTGVGSVGSPNGLATPRLLIGPDSTIKAAYAGDLQGNLWKFDFSAAGVAKAFSGAALFQAKYLTTAQPITVQPELIEHPSGGVMVVFGTGKIFETADASNTAMQSLYGIWDNSGVANVTASAITSGQAGLQQQSLSLVNSSFYQVTFTPVDWGSKRGWYANLSLASGERITIDPQILYEQVVFTSIIPGSTSDPCIADGKSTTIQLDAVTGGPLSYRTIDSNGDNSVTASDVFVSGRQGGLTFGTTILQKGRQAIIYQPNSICTGADCVNVTPSPIIYVPTVRLWRQILGKQ
jgi:type IV pilus assembly protein PilY1